jgi:hypothetical protein
MVLVQSLQSYLKKGFLNSTLKEIDDFIKNGMNILKRGWHPQPLHGQSNAVLSGASSQKLVFFCKLLKDISKKGGEYEVV